jgi:hypothetical protein
LPLFICRNLRITSWKLKRTNQQIPGIKEIY